MQSLGPLFQRHESGRSKHADLAHAAAEHFTNHPTVLDQILRADDHRPNRRAETFAEAELNGIELLCHLRDIFAQINGRVENSRAVEMNFESGVMRLVA